MRAIGFIVQWRQDHDAQRILNCFIEVQIMKIQRIFRCDGAVAQHCRDYQGQPKHLLRPSRMSNITAPEDRPHVNRSRWGGFVTDFLEENIKNIGRVRGEVKICQGRRWTRLPVSREGVEKRPLCASKIGLCAIEGKDRSRIGWPEEFPHRPRGSQLCHRERALVRRDR
jgi:hypothetical protein